MGTSNPGGVVLSAILSQGYDDVTALKAAESEARTTLVRASDITISGSETVAPVSRITIPKGAAPGYYDLTTAVRTGDATSSGSTIIRVDNP